MRNVNKKQLEQMQNQLLKQKENFEKEQTN